MRGSFPFPFAVLEGQDNGDKTKCQLNSLRGLNEESSVEQIGERDYEPNPNAPAELARFAFLIGRWRCEAKLKLGDGEWQTFPARWVGRFILDGFAIADEYRMLGAAGELIVLGMNFRSYDAVARVWKIKWLNGLTGAWTDLVSEELGGVSFDGASIVYAFKEPTAGHAYTRASYTNISKTHFTWRGERSEDGEAWSEFMVVECERDGA